MTLSELFKQKSFIITAELPPPKGTSIQKMTGIARSVRGMVDGINITDNQRSIMRMSALAFSHLIKDTGNEPIMQICCRDRNRIALQSDILGAAALNINNLCIMTGDHTTLGDHPEAKPVFDIDSIQLMLMVRNMENGKTLSGKGLVSKPSFSLGGVVNPFAEPFDFQLIKLKKKVQAGAEFFQTQPFFDLESILNFLEAVEDIKAKFLIGITPLKSFKTIQFLNKNVLTKPIPESISERIAKSNCQEMEGIKIAAELIHEIKNKADKIDGVHIMPIGVEKLLPNLLELISQ